jgi:hypothetical protein
MARRLGMALLLPQKGVAIVCARDYARRECVFHAYGICRGHEPFDLGAIDPGDF